MVKRVIQNSIAFTAKYRRKVFFGEKRREIGSILRTLCDWKRLKVIEAEVRPGHIHMRIGLPPKMAAAGFMGRLKGKSGLMPCGKLPGPKYKYRNECS
ncbi:MAG: IS200/IS605 family transposase [Ruthenibacterium sp.]